MSKVEIVGGAGCAGGGRLRLAAGLAPQHVNPMFFNERSAVGRVPVLF
jgi:hypothetical protein